MVTPSAVGTTLVVLDARRWRHDTKYRVWMWHPPPFGKDITLLRITPLYELCSMHGAEKSVERRFIATEDAVGFTVGAVRSALCGPVLSGSFRGMHDEQIWNFYLIR